MIRTTRIGLAALTAATVTALAACAGPATAGQDSTEQWPAPGTSIEWVVPSAAGGGNDILARIIAPVMQEDLGANIQVVNVEGGSQVVGLTKLATAAADGTTLGFTNVPSILGRYLDPAKQATFDRESFTPIGSFATNSVVIAVGKDSPYDTVEELFDAADGTPGQITAGTDSRAGDDHINLRLLEDAADLQFNIVHYNSGADKVAAVLSGEVDFALGGVSSFFGPWKSGDLKLLAVVEDEPSDILPEVPTLVSAGYEVAPMNSRFVLSVPAGTPENVVDALGSALEAASTDPSVVEKLTGAATVASWMPGDEVATLWAEREAEVKPIIADLLAAS